MNNLINILGKADWEDEIIEFFEQYKIPESPDFEEGDRSYTRYTPSNFIWFSFNTKCITAKQKERKAEGNYYLQTLSFHFDYRKNDENINVPFGFQHGDAYRDVIKKLGEPHFERNKINKNATRLMKVWIFTKENGEQYKVVIDFANKSKNLDLEEMLIWTVDPENPISKEYFQAHSYNPLEDKDRNIEL